MEIGEENEEFAFGEHFLGLLTDLGPTNDRFHRGEGFARERRRVYKYIVGQLQAGTRPLRLMVQASAGTGKSFLLTTVYLWCILNKLSCKAAAPTGLLDTVVEASAPVASALGSAGSCASSPRV